MEDVDGIPIVFGVNDYGMVRLSVGGLDIVRRSVDLDKDAREEFFRLWCKAERQAEPTMPP